MRDDLPTGTVTFLFTDVEGSTKLLHALGAEAYAEALADHRRVVLIPYGASSAADEYPGEFLDTIWKGISHPRAASTTPESEFPQAPP